MTMDKLNVNAILKGKHAFPVSYVQKQSSFIRKQNTISLGWFLYLDDPSSFTFTTKLGAKKFSVEFRNDDHS